MPRTRGPIEAGCRSPGRARVRRDAQSSRAARPGPRCGVAALCGGPRMPGPVIYLTYADLLYVAERAVGDPPVARDAGLLEAAAARPRPPCSGGTPTRHSRTKAAVLTDSIVQNHVLADATSGLRFVG